MKEEKKEEIQSRRGIFKNAKPLLLLFPIIFSLLSCAISNKLSLGTSEYLDLWWIQQLDDNEVLAVYSLEYFDEAVKIITFGEHYSEWQRIQGYFTCVDYWTYETAAGSIKTIPVVVKTSEYENYKKSLGY